MAMEFDELLFRPIASRGGPHVAGILLPEAGKRLRKANSFDATAPAPALRDRGARDIDMV